MKRKTSSYLKAIGAGTMVLACSGNAAADSFNLGDSFGSALDAVQQGLDFLWPDELQKEGVTARLGLAFGWMPDYVGSNNFGFRVLPVIDIRKKDIWRLNGSTFTFAAYKSGDFQAGPLVSLRFGRKESDNAALRGLGDIRNTFEVGGFARYQTKTMLASADIRQALSAGQGLTVRATLGHGLYQHGNFALGAGFRAKWYGRRAMQTNFGVTETQAENSEWGLEAFEAGAGLSETSFNVIGAFRLENGGLLYGLVAYSRLFGDAADSPLVKDAGSPSQLIFGSALTYKF